jgi:hypothetical protein
MLLKKSTVGAGDSSMVWVLSKQSLKEVILGSCLISSYDEKEHNCLNSKMQSDYLNG